MALKMKGPSLYSSSPMKLNNKNSKDDPITNVKKTKGKKPKDATRQPLRPVTNTVKKGTKKVNIPVNPKAPKVKVPKNNTSIKGKTQFEVDTQGVRNAIGATTYLHNQGIKKVKKAANKVKDYFTKR